MIIGIDFDGTCVTHDFPFVGKDIGAEPVLKKLIEKKHQLILFTMRSDKSNVKANDKAIHNIAGKYLTQAVNWFKVKNIPLYGIQTNPMQHTWTESPKAYCDLYIDDSSLGIPLIYPKGDGFDISDKPFVDWVNAEKMLIEYGILKIK